jgi:uncharacterized protein (TIGR02611 family)
MYSAIASISKAPSDPEKIVISRAVLEVKKWARNAFGFALLILGIVAIPTPVPGFLMCMLGLATLAAEFAWAQQLLDYIKDAGLRVRGAFAGRRVAPGTPLS